MHKFLTWIKTRSWFKYFFLYIYLNLNSQKNINTMHKKPLLSAVFTVFVLSLVFGYSLVFGNVNSYSGPIALDFQLSKNIYPESNKLNSNILIFKSPVDLSQAKLISSCDNYSKFVQKRNEYYIFNVKYFSPCNEDILKLEKNNETLFMLEQNIIWEYDLWEKFIDYPTKDLQKALLSLDKKLLLTSKKVDHNSGYISARNTRETYEIAFLYNVLNNIVEKRSQKYKIPVEWREISTKHSKLPNAGRPYRESYTDGIHHGWDVDGDLWEEVVSLDDAMVIRIVSGFEYSDLSRLVYGENISEDQKIKNLDTLRWNQVWLKTAKGDVVFYSHLQDIYSNIKEWMMVRKGQKIWTIWISWVPDEAYDDYHLHFPIHKNPYNSKMAWKYDYDDYMRWDWYFKENTIYEIIGLQKTVFE